MALPDYDPFRPAHRSSRARRRSSRESSRSRIRGPRESGRGSRSNPSSPPAGLSTCSPSGTGWYAAHPDLHLRRAVQQLNQGPLDLDRRRPVVEVHPVVRPVRAREIGDRITKGHARAGTAQQIGEIHGCTGSERRWRNDFLKITSFSLRAKSQNVLPERALPDHARTD
jgi:hypothetical protein